MKGRAGKLLALFHGHCKTPQPQGTGAMNVHNPHNSPPADQREDRQPETGRSGDGAEPRSRLLLRGPGSRGDRGGRRFAPGFRDERQTILVIGGGPSAAACDVATLERFPTIAVNDGYRLHPGCEAIYAADAAWWREHIKKIDQTCSEQTRLFCADPHTCESFGLEHRAVVTRGGLSQDHFTLCAGGTVGNSGAQAINLAYLAGAQRILLTGFDMRPVRGKEHWFGDHPKGVHRTSPYPVFVKGMWQLAAELGNRNIEVLNATPGSALPYWKIITQDALRDICRAPMS